MVITYLRLAKVTNLQVNHFEEGFKILHKKLSGGEILAHDFTPLNQIEYANYNDRCEKIFNIILDGDLHTAAKKSMDLLKEFFENDKERIQNIRVLCVKILLEEKQYESNKKSNPEQVIALCNNYTKKMEQFTHDLFNLIPTDYQAAA